MGTFDITLINAGPGGYVEAVDGRHYHNTIIIKNKIYKND